MLSPRKLMLATLCIAVSWTMLSPANAAYPERPITIVVGYAAGGATDILARVVAKSMATELGETVIVENKAGANSNIGAEYVARSKKDGYTIYVGTIANTINRALYDNLSYDFVKDFEPVGLMATIPNVLVVNPKLPIHTVDEYIQYAKKHPGELTCASSGIGSSIHMSCELFKIKTGTNILHVPYRGSGPAVADLLGGQVGSMFDNLPSSISHINSKALRPLAVTTEKRVPALPDTPTFGESGVKDFLVQSWFGLSVPAGTPAEIVTTLNTALNRALESSDIKTTFKKSGFTAPQQPNTSKTMKAFTQSEIDKWASVVKEANLSAN
ncbi:tripartite tricarboxylate transporter substrate binding protein [Pusillimonas sp. ANT_WB101]|nr:tripartite tricarboxylate transporter substrate binding protein [Pusillimonas sp. ANT_WB101]